MLARLVKTGNVLASFGFILSGGIAVFFLAHGEEIPGHENPAIKFLIKLGGVICIAVAVLCLILLIVDMVAMMRSDDQQAAPSGPREPNLDVFLGQLARMYKARKDVSNLTQLRWFLLLGPRGAKAETLLAELQLKQLSNQSPTLALPDDCFCFGSSLEPDAPMAKTLVWGSELDENGHHALAADVHSSQIDEKIDEAAARWRKVVKWIGRRGRCDGVLVVVGLEQLVRDEKSGTLGIALRQRAMEARASLGIEVPVFLIINSCDRIVGWSSFFLAEERKADHTVGLNFPDSATIDSDFRGWFDSLAAEAESRVGERARGAGQLRSVLTSILFPAELKQKREAIRHFLQTLSAPDDVNDMRLPWLSGRSGPLWLRALYLTGCADGPSPQGSVPKSLDALYVFDQIPHAKEAAWQGFLANIGSQYHEMPNSSRRALPRTNRAWLRGYAFRLATGWTAMIIGSAGLGVFYGSERVRLGSVERSVNAFKSEKGVLDRSLIEEHASLVRRLRSDAPALTQDQLARLQGYGMSKFEGRYLQPAEARRAEYASLASVQNELFCSPNSQPTDKDVVLKLIKNALEHQGQSGGIALTASAEKALDESLDVHSACHPERIAQLARDVREAARKKMIETAAGDYEDIVMQLKLSGDTVPEGSTVALPRLFLPDNGLRFHAAAQNKNCYAIRRYEDLHRVAWLKWLKDEAKARAIAYDPPTCSEQSAAAKACVPLAMELAKVRPSLTCSSPSVSQIAQALTIGIAVINGIEKKLPQMVGILLSKKHDPQLGQAKAESEFLARLAEPFKALADFRRDSPSEPIKAYFVALAGMRAQLDGLQKNNQPTGKAVPDGQPDASRAGQAFNLVLKTKQASKESALTVLDNARQAMIQKLKDDAALRSQDAEIEIITELDEILLGAEAVEWEVLSILALEYVDKKMQRGKELAHAMAEDPSSQTANAVAEFFNNFIDGQNYLYGLTDFAGSGQAFLQHGYSLVSNPDGKLQLSDVKADAERLIRTQKNSEQNPPQTAPPQPQPQPPTPPAPATPVATPAAGPEVTGIVLEPDPRAECAHAIPERIELLSAGVVQRFRFVDGSGRSTQAENQPIGGNDTGLDVHIRVGSGWLWQKPPVPAKPGPPWLAAEQTCKPDDRCLRVPLGALRDNVGHVCTLTGQMTFSAPLHPRPVQKPAVAAAATPPPQQPKPLPVHAWPNPTHKCWMQWQAPGKGAERPKIEP